jgi:AraC-like DNA-binding protein
MLGEQAQRQGEAIYQPLGLGTQYNLPAVLGQGGDRILPLRNELTIHVRQAMLRHTLRLKQHHNADFPLTAKFYLSGSSQVTTQGRREVAPEYTEAPGCNYLYYLPELTEVEEWRSQEAIHVVMICAPTSYFRLFYPSHDPDLAQPLQQLLTGEGCHRFHQPLGQTTAAMERALQQLLHAPFQGITQQLYLESKAMELLALQFAQWAETPPREHRRRLSKDERERLHAAKNLLLRDLMDVPTLGTIAQQVGLSEYRLKQGFQHLFGTTPFSYWQRHRLEMAQTLLRESHLSIAGVATRVGYCNPEAFSTAFRRQFGISPKAYQLGKQP